MAKKKAVEDVKTTKKKSKKVEEKISLLKELPGEEKYTGVSPINRFNILFADLQFIFTILTLVFFIWYIFDSRMWDTLQFILGITLLVIGYNNKIIYDKPRKATFYFICGAIILILEILSLILGVIA